MKTAIASGEIMMRMLLALSFMTLPAIASAQTFPAPPISIPDGQIYSHAVESYGWESHETPTMRQEKLKRAIALKAEAARLVEQDGGTLTREHLRYVRRQAADILSYQRCARPMGSLIAVHC